MSVTRAGGESTELMKVLGISVGLPAMLGVTPVAGRLLGPGDARPDAPAAVMVSEGFWKRELEASPDAIGREVRLGGTPHTACRPIPPRGNRPRGPVA